jgi:transcriptional regulator with XRE-family HTH domain
VNIVSDISKRILDIILAKEISYGELADRTGIPKSALQRYATGETEKIPIDRLQIIAKAIGTTTAYLMGWEDADDPLPLPSTKRDIPDRNIIRLCGRDGSYEERVLNDEQIAALKVILSQLPDASGDL